MIPSGNHFAQPDSGQCPRCNAPLPKGEVFGDRLHVRCGFRTSQQGKVTTQLWKCFAVINSDEKGVRNVKVTKTHQGAPEIVLAKGEIRDLEKAYGHLDQLAFKGRQGCVIGEQPYNAEGLEKTARFVLSIIAAAKKVQETAGEVSAATTNPQS